MRGQPRSQWAANLTVLVLAVVAVLAALVALQPPAAPARVPQPGTVVPDPEAPLAAFIGDSYSAGTGASSAKRRWTTLVAADEGWRELNLARGGTGFVTAASEEGCGQPECPNYQVMLKDAVRANAAIVVVAGGQNDLGQDPADVARAVRATFEGVRKGLPEATIVAVGPSTPGPNRRIGAIDQAVRRSAAEVGATYVSLLDPVVIKSSMLAEDKVHVNNAGHAAIARRVIEGLS